MANALPPDVATYHFNAVPVAVRFATVLMLQTVKELEPDGAAVAEATVTATAVLVLSQEFSVCET